jgi:hypothetical protein
MEQLVAESTGKNGISIIPIDREPVLEATDYGSDRIFAFMTVEGDTRFDRFKLELADEDHPYVAVEVVDIMALGQEFFRWEFATAIAGSLMEINPFDQPDVESAKIEAKKITETYEDTGELPVEEPFFSAPGFDCFGDLELAGRVVQIADCDLPAVLKTHLSRIQKGDYFALLAYLEMSPKNEGQLQSIREMVLRKYNVATCLGFGPRFLHSTGQAYKGGADNGVFLQVTSNDVKDLDVPDQKYTFGVVKSAQSRGDFQVLLDRRRRALTIHIEMDPEHGLDTLVKIISSL